MEGRTLSSVIPLTPQQPWKVYFAIPITDGETKVERARILFYFILFWSNYVVQAGLELSILLPPPPEFWDYRSAPPHLASGSTFKCRSVWLYCSLPS
jgi:hypothetical protein